MASVLVNYDELDALVRRLQASQAELQAAQQHVVGVLERLGHEWRGQTPSRVAQLTHEFHDLGRQQELVLSGLLEVLHRAAVAYRDADAQLNSALGS